MLFAFALGCQSASDRPNPVASEAIGEVTDAPSVEAPAETAQPSAAPSSAAQEPTNQPVSQCPDGMLPIPGGDYWAGAADAGGVGDEHPRHRVRMHSFCLDRTEVTTDAYEACVAEGKCESARRNNFTCNSGRDRGRHPINCVSWDQAVAFCKTRGARLPTELEWEYAARGGAEYRTYSWGSDPPDGNTCWKQNKSCEVATHREGAFGLHDMNGNVWEWTSTWYGPYPWPQADGVTKVYRGGSWSRRFEKWLSLTLRDRLQPSKFGSHLGFRCAALQADTKCPYGREEDGCRFGIEEVECKAPLVWNGLRCAKPGEQGCGEGRHELSGHGCVGADGVSHRPPSGVREQDTAPVSARREPRFDADCERFQPKRPVAWRFEGGSHAARNRAGSAKGCKNRDVGVGWNSACCP